MERRETDNRTDQKTLAVMHFVLQPDPVEETDSAYPRAVEIT